MISSASALQLIGLRLSGHGVGVICIPALKAAGIAIGLPHSLGFPGRVHLGIGFPQDGAEAVSLIIA